MNKLIGIFCLALAIRTGHSSADGSASIQNTFSREGLYQLKHPISTYVPIPAIIIPSPEPLNPDEIDVIWKSLEGILPTEYYETVEKYHLNTDPKILASILNLVLNQIALEVDTLFAKQAIFNKYIGCACNDKRYQISCVREEQQNYEFTKLWQPYFVSLTPKTDLGFALRMIRLMQYHLDQAKLSHRNMAASVECSCPHSDICNKQIDSNVYAIASGSKDDYLDHIYWQEVFRDVSNDIPSDIPQTIKASLQNAWADLLENIFGNISNQSTPIWGWLDQILTNIPHNHTAAKQSNTFISEKLTAGLFGLFSGFDNEATGTTDSIQERNLESLKTKKPRTTPKTV